MKQDYKIKTPYGEIVFTEPGKNGEHDMKIFSKFPSSPWPHSLYYVGIILRLKRMVEDRNYPPPAKGRKMLQEFCNDCVMTDMKIRDICKKYKIKLPDGEDND